MMIPPETRERILTMVQETVQAGYYAPDFHGKHWYEIVASHRPAIFDATTAEDFEREMNTMLVDLDSSMRLLGPNSKITARNAINASFHAVDVPNEGTRWVFQDVAPGGVAQRSGVQPADVLLTMNGAPTAPPERPLSRWIEQRRLRFSAAMSENSSISILGRRLRSIRTIHILSRA
jgi:hypothetical protein